MRVARILHAGYLFETLGTKQDTQILFDPLFETPFSENCFSYPAVQFDYKKIAQLRPGAVFISHFHDDHFSLQSLKHLCRETPIYFYCVYDEYFDILREMGFSHVHKIYLGEKIKVGSFEITALPALEPEVDCIFHIANDGLNILNVVDAWIDPLTMSRLARVSCWDLVLWPFQTMREAEILSPLRSEPYTPEIPMEHLEQLKLMKPRFIVPSSCQFIHESWSWYNQALFPNSYSLFSQEMATHLPKTQVVRMNPASVIELYKDHLKQKPLLSWVIPIGDQEVDYCFDPRVVPTPTREIAQNFGPLSKKQVKVIEDYCERKIFQRYSELTFQEDSYFSRSRIWQLSVFDHLGHETRWMYQIHGTELRALRIGECKVDWVTEILQTKLCSALERGETLSSLYLRVNPNELSVDVEEQLKDVDILEDPLIRCLYEGVSAAYQRHQLENIKNDPSAL